MNAGCPIHKRKDSALQWIYHYALHKWRHEMGLGALRSTSLKPNARKYATYWRFIL
ncbi:hypothetical protein [Bartonella grahamii]|uniref:hypothetical protein n=1 Tax=Bartonella grahamii TaxID=33045 RepID=UPI002E7AC57E|nr:hypothetical protein [Bartonella grahamii]